MNQYLYLLNTILRFGDPKSDRTGTGTQSMFGHQMIHDMRDGFPLLTTKKMFFKAIAYELLWFLRGDTNVAYLNDHGITIWDEWADEDGDLGPVYGHQWRRWAALRREDPTLVPFRRIPGYEICSIDQIQNALERLKTDPMSRRHIVTAWNPADVDKMALPPCHCLFQFNCAEIDPIDRRRIISEETPDFVVQDAGREVDGEHERLDSIGAPRYYLDLQLYQRSADVFLGVPFNIASYALLQIMFGHVLNMVPRRFIHTFGDVHIYNNHREQVQTQLERKPRPLPKLVLAPDTPPDLFQIDYHHFKLEGYDPFPTITAPVSV